MPPGAPRGGVRRWCDQGSVLLAEDASGPVGYAVPEYTFWVAPEESPGAARRPRTVRCSGRGSA
ncbi:hypothetical protein ABZZ16_13635 [Streptomyces sp. NPDC006386]|uniref:hypothetical protein n=1 Tax=Streptomyces sp. NPDC006386 TaxID=3156762 RepID=UPI0033B6BEE9